MVLPELDQAHQGPLFPDLSLEDPDLKSIMGDEVSPEMKILILAADGFRYLSSVNCEDEQTFCQRDLHFFSLS